MQRKRFSRVVLLLLSAVLVELSPFAGAAWQEGPKFLASDGRAFDFFGVSVSISGSTAIVGACGDDDMGYESGSAYIFKDTGSGWTRVAKLAASDGAAMDDFGWSVSISGGIAIVGARFDDDRGSDAGAAYIFQDTGSGWAEVAKFTASDGAADNLFGSSGSISGGTVIVGTCMGYAEGMNAGAAYIFEDTGSGWAQVAKLTAGDGAKQDYFGSSVSISGGTVIVGAGCDDNRGSNSGSAYVFKPYVMEHGTVWTGSGWMTVNLTQPFTDPVVVAGPAMSVGCIRPGIEVWRLGEAVLLEITGSSARRRKDPDTGFDVMES